MEGVAGSSEVQEQDSIRRAWHIALGACARADARGYLPANEQEITRFLGAALRAISHAFAADLTDWLLDNTHDGYLLQRDEAGRIVMVPFHLVADFPNRDLLSALNDVAKGIQAGGIICLSGSAVFLGTLLASGDLDFCEYIADDNEEAFARLATFAAQSSENSENMVCVRIRVGEHTWLRPWNTSGRPTALNLAKTAKAIRLSQRHGKVDLVVANAVLGGIEVTNVLVWHEARREESGAMTRSFAFQEAILSEAKPSWIPRRLAHPEGAGRYINFMLDEIRKYVVSAPVKAAKRALALAVFMLLREEADDLRELLNSSPAVILDAFHQRTTLIKSLQAHRDPAVAAMVPHVQEGLEKLRYSYSNLPEPNSDMAQECLNVFTKKIEDIISKMLGEVDLIINGT